MQVVLSGKVDDETYKLIASQLEQVRQGEKRFRAKSQIMHPSTQSQFHERLNAAQSAVRLGRRAFNKTDDRYKPFLVLNTVFGGYFGSRLMSNIREEKGFTYGIYSILRSHLNSGLFLISSEIGNKYYVEAIEEIWKEIDRMKDEAIPQQELDLVKNYLAGSFLSGIDGPFNKADSIVALLKYDLPFSRLEELFDHVQSVDAQSLQDLAIEFFDREQFFEVTVGNREN